MYLDEKAMKLQTMQLEKRIFFDTEDDKIGHCSIYKKRNGNTYIVYYVEERYRDFQEFDSNMKLIDGSKILDFSMNNRKSYNADYFTS